LPKVIYKAILKNDFGRKTMAEFYLGFWNLENLFGPANHPRPDWVKNQTKADLKGWTKALYTTKLKQLTKVITAMNGGAGPDILGVCEVEDESVLKDLVSTIASQLPGRNYDTVFASEDLSSRGIDTAFIYDKNQFSVDNALIFNHFVMRRTGTRDILQATFKQITSGKEIVVMANHWPSRFGGSAEDSAGFRATAGETLSYWHSRIFEAAPLKNRTPVVAFGDLNDDPWDRSVTVNALATRERGDVRRARSPKFYNLAWEYQITEVTDLNGKKRELEGSLYYNDNGNLFDQILLNRPLLDAKKDSGFKFIDGSGGLFALPAMVSHKTGLGPRRFGLPKGNAAKNVEKTGFSDHFPVVLKVKEV
jgi:endonuclease/exonuclease/phosphatase family metal-dependent hydrolase